LVNVGTVHQVETFHQWLISDLCKRTKQIDYLLCLNDENRSKTKKYYIVPLKKQGNCYEIDNQLIQRVERLNSYGYKNEQPNIIEWLNQFPDWTEKLQ
jgi:hypothetical protein